MERRPSIAVIGSGNVATHLSLALAQVADVMQVYSPCLAHAEAMAARIEGCKPTDDIEQITRCADFYLIAVKDDAIASVSASMPYVDGIVMHTSGSIAMDAVTAHRRGVFYPLQTFSKDTKVDIAEVPFFIEGVDPMTADKIRGLALSISPNVYFADSAQRTILHIAAVFGCNFFNHLLNISSQILQTGGYDLSVLHPLLKLTLQKAFDIGPAAAQTGPAVRHDTGIVDKHLAALPPDQAQIYRLLSQSIMDAHPL